MSANVSRPAGTLFLVVGASGVGKDTLIREARVTHAGSHVFARRVITRPADAGGEDHEAVSDARFAELAAGGAFSLQWSAHGLSYAIRRSDTDRLADGMHVVANVSRSIIPDSRTRFPHIRIVHVTASAAALRRRLEERGRETAEDIASRLARATAPALPGDDVIEVPNDGALEEAIEQFRAALTLAQAAARGTSSLQVGMASATSEAILSGRSKN